MAAQFDRWLRDRLGAAPTLARPVLLLCRTDAAAHSAKTWAARERGFVGLEIRTLRALAHQLEGPWLAPVPIEDPLPVDPMLDRIRLRPGLLQLARQHGRSYRLAAAALGDVTAPAWLHQVGRSSWRDDTVPERRLLELARSHGSHLTPSIRYHRVVTLGFEGPLEPWEHATLDALGGTPHPNAERTPPQRSIEVSDPAAEARAATLLAQQHGEDTLILVHHPATAARVHRSLVRNGSSTELRRTTRLDRHTLASVIRRCVPWFGGAEDPAIRAVDLHDVLRHPMLGDHLPEPARLWLELELEALGEPTHTRLHPRGLARAIRRARHLHAPLSAWIVEVNALSKRTDDTRLSADALRLLARLQVLGCTLRSEDWQQAFPVDAPDDDPGWSDFDAQISRLLAGQDEQLEELMPTPGTLGCLRRFLHACKVRTRDDAAARQILGALRRGAERPATRTDLLLLLAGSADRDEIGSGVQILRYDEYDGRPCAQVILLDVHDQGLVARAKPDPLLGQTSIAALGLLDGRARVEHRLDQLRRACAAAGESVAIIARHDTMGRALVSPIQLTLNPEPSDVGAYGLRAALPERTEQHALTVVPETARAPTSDALADHLALQASIEWFRHGQGASSEPPVSQAPGAPTLTHQLVTRRPPATWLAPWLGEAPVPEAALGEAHRSASGFFKPLTHCLYQAFVRTQLGIREPEEVGDELDPREIGNAVHDALEQVATRAPWSTTADVLAVRASFEEALRRATDVAFDATRADFGALSPARIAATRGLQSRWSHHWGLYTTKRVQHASPERTHLQSADALVYQHHWVDSAALALATSGALAELPPVEPVQLRRWVLNASADIVVDGRSARLSGFPGGWEPVLRAFLEHPSFRRVLDLRDTSLRLSTASKAPILASAAEVPFGDLGARGKSALGLGDETVDLDLGEQLLELGAERVPVRGKIDRIDVVEQARGPLVRIVDYKTGRNAPSVRQGLRQLMRLVEPQLIIYALVLRQAVRDGDLPAPLGDATLATVGWDHPRAVKGEKDLQDACDAFPMDGATLDLLGRAIGHLVARARRGSWPLHPHADTCPQLNNWGHDHCPYVGACRFKAHG